MAQAVPVRVPDQVLAPAVRADQVAAVDTRLAARGDPGARVVLDPADPVVAGPAVDPVVPVVVDLADPVVPVDSRVPAAKVATVRAVPAVRVDNRALVDLVVRVVLDRVVRADLTVPVDLVDLVDPVDPVARVDPEVPASLVATDRVVPVARVDLRARVDLKVRVVPADPVGQVVLDLVVRVVPVDRHRLRTSSVVSTTAVARTGVAPTTRRTASARPTTAHRLRRPREDSAGTVDLLPERRRQTGTDRRLPEAGMDRLLPADGTRAGMDRHATSVTPSAISDRSRTTVSTRSRSSTRCSVGGASGSSERGSRCTDVDPTSATGLPSSPKAGGQSSSRGSWKRLRSSAAQPEKNASVPIPLQDVRRGYVPR